MLLRVQEIDAILYYLRDALSGCFVACFIILRGYFSFDDVVIGNHRIVEFVIYDFAESTVSNLPFIEAHSSTRSDESVVELEGEECKQRIHQE